MSLTRLAVLCVCSAIALPQPGFVAAQSYPERTIRLIVPLAPGGGNDAAARLIASGLAKRFGQAVVVENRPGGGSVIASQTVLGQPADGYTLYLLSASFNMAPLLHRKLPFDAVRDFAPLSRIGVAPGALVVHPSLPVRKVVDLVTLAKANPHEIAFGSSGPGGGSHLAGELFNLMAKVQMLHVPYKGSALAITSVLSGETQVAFSSPTASLPHIHSGRLRLIAVTTGKRWPLLPGAPTIQESGVPGYESLIWTGLAVRAGTPPAVLERIHKELIALLNSQDIASVLAKETALPTPESPEAFERFLADERKKWLPVLKKAGLAKF